MPTTSGVKVVTYPAVTIATPLHVGTNAAQVPLYLDSFLVQNNGGASLFIGDSQVTGDSDGITVVDGATLRAEGSNSRGETSQYDMTKIYYIGSSFKLIYDKGD